MQLFKIGLASLNPTVGAIESNVSKTIGVAAEMEASTKATGQLIFGAGLDTFPILTQEYDPGGPALGRRRPFVFDVWHGVTLTPSGRARSLRR